MNVRWNRYAAGIAAALVWIATVINVGAEPASELPYETLAGTLGEALAEKAPGHGFSVTRLEASLRTVSEADAWPSAWLVLQDLSISNDVVVHVSLEGDGRTLLVGTVLVADRREWDAAAVRAAVREITGRKPREKIRDVVVQGFRTRTETRYPYAVDSVERKGLLALLPEGTILREARSVELDDGDSCTVAISLRSAEFVPAACGACWAAVFGHADTGTIEIVLAGNQGIEDRLDITAWLGGHDGRPLVPRFACETNDPGEVPNEATVRSWMEDRQPLPLLIPQDIDGDGLALEFVLPAGYPDCRELREVAVGVDPASRVLRLLPLTPPGEGSR